MSALARRELASTAPDGSRSVASLGIEVLGLDLTNVLDRSSQEELRSLLYDQRCVLVRQEGLSPDDLKRFVGLFGPLFDEAGNGSFYSYNSNVRNDSIVPIGSLLPHNDFVWCPFPHWLIGMYAAEVTGESTPMQLIDATAAYAALPAGLRDYLDLLSATQLIDFTDSVNARGDIPIRSRKDLPASFGRPSYPHVSHAVVMTHPRSGARHLFVNERLTLAIDGIPRRESDELLARVFSHMYSPEFTYDHYWQEGDLLLWDNLALQHGRRGAVSDPTSRRTLVRASVNEYDRRTVFAGFVHLDTRKGGGVLGPLFSQSSAV